MNRLVIIGNGFDLAHGLPTSYKDFIDDYWKGIIYSNHNDEFVSFDLQTHVEFENIKNLNDVASAILACDDSIKFSDAEIYREYGNNILTGKYPRAHVLIYKNTFFKLINQKCIQNWVDIENEYYGILKGIVKSECLNISKSKQYWLEEQKNQVEKLNREFEQVQKLLERYLITNIIDTSSKIGPISAVFKINKGSEEYFQEFSSQDQDYLKTFYQDYINKRSEIKTRILNFNYTRTVDKYIALTKEYGEFRNYGNIENIQIHGRLEDIGNRINFGFGDEMDDDYKMIENIDDNEYLKNFKSFQYLQNSNYKNLLDYIGTGRFQVLIMGHSCGLSDRTLLHTIFEHINCRSIKVFYYEQKDIERNVITDNYTEIIQNISRHFNKKKLMREKIVNKTLCQPLPQIQLPLR
ncbi:Bacteriophage abortive infection AbiH [Flavobacterium micromati]|uniref:Bacteriophage abortive infection AbiH n=1 Tax=Flavobacterium micromati TaxID=229205 RepID=A0A1M5FV29_9FLAO|nr:AbiH family protein [Flavobacterium micromati]SHF95400.1 Bacteriophage abortive infection AbiH [Flavobacterium micromati]